MINKAFVFAMALILTAVLAPSGAIAGHHGCGMFQTSFEDIDGNKDGLVTYEELNSQHDYFNTSAFQMLDTDDNEVLDREEWRIFLKAHGVKPSGEMEN